MDLPILLWHDLPLQVNLEFNFLKWSNTIQSVVPHSDVQSHQMNGIGYKLYAGRENASFFPAFQKLKNIAIEDCWIPKSLRKHSILQIQSIGCSSGIAQHN
jgi:hypothetical protein